MRPASWLALQTPSARVDSDKPVCICLLLVYPIPWNAARQASTTLLHAASSHLEKTSSTCGSLIRRRSSSAMATAEYIYHYATCYGWTRGWMDGELDAWINPWIRSALNVAAGQKLLGCSLSELCWSDLPPARAFSRFKALLMLPVYA